MNIRDIPWQAIAYRTAQITVITAVSLTGLAVLGIRQAEAEQRERERPRWTDAARWER